MTAQPSVSDGPVEGAAQPDDVADRTLPSPRTSVDPVPLAVVPAPSAPGRRAPLPVAPSPTPRAPAGLDTPRIDGLYGRPAPTGRTSALAVCALLAGGLAPPLGILLGVVALRRLRDRGDRGRGLAIWGVVLGSVISLLVVLGLALSTLFTVGSAGAQPGAQPTAGGVSEVCSGTICTVTARGAPVTVDGIGVGGADGVTVLAIGDGTAAVASREGPLEVPTGTALELQAGTEVVLTQASADTVVLVYER